MARRNQRRPNGRNGAGSRPSENRVSFNNGFPVLKVMSLPQNFVTDAQRLWNLVLKSPFKAVGGFLAFLSSFISVKDALFSSKTGNSATGPGALDWLVANTAGKLLVYAIVACSLGWTFAVLTGWLSRAKGEAWRVVGYVAAMISGLLLVAVSENLLVATNSNQTKMQGAYLLIAFGNATAIGLARKYFQLSLETDMVIIERRALVLMIFALSSAVSTLFLLLSAVK